MRSSKHVQYDVSVRSRWMFFFFTRQNCPSKSELLHFSFYFLSQQRNRERKACVRHNWRLCFSASVSPYSNFGFQQYSAILMPRLITELPNTLSLHVNLRQIRICRGTVLFPLKRSCWPLILSPPLPVRHISGLAFSHWTLWSVPSRRTTKALERVTV